MTNSITMRTTTLVTDVDVAANCQMQFRLRRRPSSPRSRLVVSILVVLAIAPAVCPFLLKPTVSHLPRKGMLVPQSDELSFSIDLDVKVLWGLQRRQSWFDRTGYESKARELLYSLCSLIFCFSNCIQTAALNFDNTSIEYTTIRDFQQ
jgi:hypothetical protein